MKAALLIGPNNLMLKDLPVPVLQPGDVLIRVRAATVCGTDIRIFRGKKTAGIRYPSVLGHEFAGEIVDTGGCEELSIGERVAICPAFSCGRCDLCKSGQENLCVNGEAVGYEIDGAFAELIRIPARAVFAGNIRKLPDGMPYEQAALAEPLACVLNGQEKVSLSAGDEVLILGAGPIGQLHIRLARQRGAAKIIVSDPNAQRRDAAIAGGADAVIDPTSEDVAARVRKETSGRGASVVICAIGVPALAKQTTDLVAHGGRISLFAGFSRNETAEIDVNAIHYKEITMTGAFGLSRRDYDRAFDMIAGGRMDAGGLITHNHALDEALRAFEIAESGEAIKVVIRND